MENKCVNELRVLSAEMIHKAKSGHTGIALGCAPIIYSLYANVMAVDCDDDKNFNRDRFVLSAGHGSSFLYAMLHGMGFNITINDLKAFRQLNSITSGHPEFGLTSGVDCSTGPLGQGVANAVGMAIAEKYLASKYNKPDCKLIDNHVFCMVGDGCLQEGIAYESLSLAGNLNLNNFTLIYDCNSITIEGSTQLSFTDDIKKRFQAINFDVFVVKNGNSVKDITNALLKAKKSNRPSIVIVKTSIGYGSELEGSEKIHGIPLTDSQLKNLKIKLQVNKPEFDLTDKVKELLKQKSSEAKNRLQSCNNTEKYKKLYEPEYKEFISCLSGNIKQSVLEKVKKIKLDTAESTRDLNHKIINELDKLIPNLIGGSADVATSTKSYVSLQNPLNKNNYSGKYIHFGVREHAMAGITNGMCLYGGLLPYQSCFLSFVDYLKPALRMAALTKLQQLLVCSHDSIASGEDGPTHQPVEQFATLRAMPNLFVFRPYNATEILAGYYTMLTSKAPTLITVSKDKPEILNSDIDLALKGGYTICENKSADVTLVATGSDVGLAIKVSKLLENNKLITRIVSMPCVSIFQKQTYAYRKSVLKDKPKVFIEASADSIWYKLANKEDLVLTINNFGTSAKPSDVYKYMQFDDDSLKKKILKWHKNLKN